MSRIQPSLRDSKPPNLFPALKRRAIFGSPSGTITRRGLPHATLRRQAVAAPSGVGTACPLIKWICPKLPNSQAAQQRRHWSPRQIRRPLPTPGETSSLTRNLFGRLELERTHRHSVSTTPTGSDTLPR